MKESNYFQEKRKYPRVPYTLPVEYITQNGTGRELCRDISRGGLFLGTGDFKKEIYLGQDIFLNIPSRDRSNILKIMGKVTRVDIYGFGVKFKKRI